VYIDKGDECTMKKNEFHTPVIENKTIEELSAELLIKSKQLSDANLNLQMEQKERKEMLSNISHDLRAPITAIRNAIDYLNSGHTTDINDYISFVKLIDRRTKTLENLIHDMYYLFCVEDDSKELDYQIVPAFPFLEEYYYDALADSKYDNKVLELDIPDTLECNIRIDVQKMIRVLDNLFTNAAKYSNDGAMITLKACLNNTNERLLICVEDTGIGIPKDSLPHIFNRTYTVCDARTPEGVTGSGLGLSIVKAIVERMDGLITCESTEGKGSTFCIELPVI